MRTSTVSSTAALIARGLGEARLDLGLSQRDVARLSGVSRPTIDRLEHGLPVAPALVVKVATALLVSELYGHEVVTELAGAVAA